MAGGAKRLQVRRIEAAGRVYGDWHDVVNELGRCHGARGLASRAKRVLC